MTAMTMTRALAHVTGELIDSHDVTATLQMLVVDCAEALSASPTGLLALGVDGRLELMASSSHVAAELELYHSQVDEGPALDAIRSGAALQVVTRQAIHSTWPHMFPVITSADVKSVVAAPLRWHGRSFGALNVFRLSEGDVDSEALAAIQCLADLAALCIAYAHSPGKRVSLTDALQRALDGRTVIEHAKGVIAVQDGVSLAAAFTRLVTAADGGEASLPAMASRAVARGERGQHWLA